MRIGTVDPEMVEKVDLEAIDLEDPELYTHGDPAPDVGGPEAT